MFPSCSGPSAEAKARSARARRLLVAWALLWLIGFHDDGDGDRQPRRARPPRLASTRSARGLRIALVAGMVLLLGFVILAGTIAFVQSCERPCIGGGGVVGNFSTASAACGAVCAIPVGQGRFGPSDFWAPRSPCPSLTGSFPWSRSHGQSRLTKGSWAESLAIRVTTGFSADEEEDGR